MIQAGWVKRANHQNKYGWQPVVAGLNGVEPTIQVAAPCFLEAVISRHRSVRIRNGKRLVRSYCTYGFVTHAAEASVAKGKGCMFSLDSEFARLLRFYLPLARLDCVRFYLSKGPAGRRSAA